MKKMILSLAFVAMGVAAFAQKPSAGNITTEMGFTSLLGTPSNPQTLNIAQPMLRVRYFLSPGMALRGHVGFGSSSNTTTIETAPGVTPVVSAETKVSTTGFGIALGIEKHLAGTTNLSPYLGAELGYGMGSSSRETSNSNNAAGTPTTAGDSYKTSGGSTSTIAVNAFLGGDYYLTEKVYFGVELGIGLFTMNSTGDADTESTTAGVTTKVTTKGSSGNSFGLMPQAIGQVRLGIILF